MALPVGNHSIHVPFTDTHVWFLWDTNTNHTAAYNLTQTLLTTTPLILTGLAVAFAFRCGLFNIGGQGQYVVRRSSRVQTGLGFTSMAKLPPHRLCAHLCCARWSRLGGNRRLPESDGGRHEVITTIMLNWIAFWGGEPSRLASTDRCKPTQTRSVPIRDTSRQVARSCRRCGVTRISRRCTSASSSQSEVSSLFLDHPERTTLGYEVRAVGFNPEAARYGGISVARSYFLAMAIAGGFAGLAGAIDVLGWEFHLDLTVVQSSQIGFFGIAVALLGRNTAVGVAFPPCCSPGF